VIVQIAVGTQVREAVDSLNQAGVPRSDWAVSLSTIFLWHKALSWLVTISVLTWFGFLWRVQRVDAVAWIAVALLAIQAISGYLLVATAFAAILQPVHLVAAMLLAGLVWWSLIRGPRPAAVASAPVAPPSKHHPPSVDGGRTPA
jgi:cytochrome c oxidase assembly protein subunit 15